MRTLLRWWTLLLVLWGRLWHRPTVVRNMCPGLAGQRSQAPLLLYVTGPKTPWEVMGHPQVPQVGKVLDGWTVSHVSVQRLGNGYWRVEVRYSTEENNES